MLNAYYNDGLSLTIPSSHIPNVLSARVIDYVTTSVLPYFASMEPSSLRQLIDWWETVRDHKYL